MTLEKYLALRENYLAIIRHLDSLLYQYHCIADTKEWFEIHEHKKRAIKHKDNCTLEINQLCKHQYETDSIDLDPDRSQTICFCTVCGHVK